MERRKKMSSSGFHKIVVKQAAGLEYGHIKLTDAHNITVYRKAAPVATSPRCPHFVREVKVEATPPRCPEFVREVKGENEEGSTASSSGCETRRFLGSRDGFEWEVDIRRERM